MEELFLWRGWNVLAEFTVSPARFDPDWMRSMPARRLETPGLAGLFTEGTGCVRLRQ